MTKPKSGLRNDKLELPMCTWIRGNVELEPDKETTIVAHYTGMNNFVTSNMSEITLTNLQQAIDNINYRLEVAPEAYYELYQK